MTPIRLLILDVDGVLTDGALRYTSNGEESKTFFVQDGSAVRRWQQAGGMAALLSGRKSDAVAKRAEDLGIAWVVQGLGDKMPAYEAVCRDAKVKDAEVAFMGDDWLDLPPMKRCGYAIAPAGAIAAVKRAARYVTRRPGGAGAVAEAVERLMRFNAEAQPVLTARTQGK